MPFIAAAGINLLASVLLGARGWWAASAAFVFAAAMGVYFRVGPPDSPVVDIGSPVAGRWDALNSPTTRVPSHLVHAWAQTYAIDLVYRGKDESSPPAGWWPIARRPEDYPGFLEPVHSPVDGVVVTSVDAMRDHWSRTSPPGLVYFMAEGVRELLGPLGVMGNRIVIRSDEGHYVLLAHLARHSIVVDRDDRIRRGDVVAACGNSGNSTEPHLHLQVMDHPSPWLAAGLPFTFDGQRLPANGATLATVIPETS